MPLDQPLNELETKLHAYLQDPGVAAEEKQRAVAAYQQMQAAPPNLEQAVTSVPGKLAAEAPLVGQAAAKGTELAVQASGLPQMGQDIEQRGWTNFLAREGATLAATGAIGSTPVGRAVIGAVGPEAEAVASRVWRYALAPIISGITGTAIEETSRKAAGMPLETPGGMVLRTINGALSQWPAAFLQGRQLRNQEITTLDDEIAKMVQRHRGEVETGGARAQAALGTLEEQRKGAIPGLGVVTGPPQPVYGPGSPAENLATNVGKQVFEATKAANRQKNAMYNGALATAKQAGANATGMGPDFAQDAGAAADAIERRGGSGPLVNALRSIQQEATSLTDVPFETMDKWRGELQKYAAGSWAKAKTPESYTKGTVQGFFDRLRGTMAQTVEGTPAAQQFQAANDYFGTEVVRLRNLNNQVRGASTPAGYLESLRESVRSGTPGARERAAKLLDTVDPDTAQTLRQQFQETLYASHLDANGDIDGDKLRKTVVKMMAKGTTGPRDMQVVFGQKGSVVRDAVDAYIDARNHMQLHDLPVNLSAAQQNMDQAMKAAGVKKEELVGINDQGINRMFALAKAGSIPASLALSYEALNSIAQGNWKAGLSVLGSMGGGAGGVMFAKIFSDRTAIKSLAKMGRISASAFADSAASKQQLVRLGGALVASVLNTDFVRAEKAAGEATLSPGSPAPPAE